MLHREFQSLVEAAGAALFGRDGSVFLTGEVEPLTSTLWLKVYDLELDLLLRARAFNAEDELNRQLLIERLEELHVWWRQGRFYMAIFRTAWPKGRTA